MVHTKSARSVRSIRSTRSSKSGFGKTFRDERKADGDIHSLDNMLIMACAKFNCPYLVSVKKKIKQDDYYKNLKHTDQKVRSKRISLMGQLKVPNESEHITSTHSQSIATTSSISLNTIIVTMIYDNYNTLTEIVITRVKEVPRVLLRIISLLVPYYRNLNRVTISECHINMYTIYELSKIINASTITEICLDGTSVEAADYSMLMETTNLKNLSLCRCNIDDDTFKLMTAKLHCAASAQNLSLLNLSSNRITDEGAKHISIALRSNRHLRYLNLADNHITDFGAGHILDVLIEFPLTHDEIINMRTRRIQYLKCRNDIYAKYLADCVNRSIDEFSQVSRKSGKRRKTSVTTLRSKSSARKEKELPIGVNNNEDYMKAKAEMMTAEIMGQFRDPFHPDTIKIIEGYIYSLGNLILAHLNLAYNNLTYLTVRRLQNVIKYQNMIGSSQGGLIKIVLEGNNLPISCEEMSLVDELMARNTWRYSSKISDNLMKKNRK